MSALERMRMIPSEHRDPDFHHERSTENASALIVELPTGRECVAQNEFTTSSSVPSIFADEQNVEMEAKLEDATSHSNEASIEQMLSPALYETYQLLSQGYTPAQISQLLDISPASAQQRASRVARQLGVSFHKEKCSASELTPAEQRIFELHHKGLTKEEIAENLNIEPDSVQTYRGRIAKKTGQDLLEPENLVVAESISLPFNVENNSKPSTGDVHFYNDGKSVMLNDQIIELNPREYSLLKVLLKHPEGIHKDDIALLLEITGKNTRNSVEASKTRLIKALSGSPELAATIKSVGKTGYLKIDRDSSSHNNAPKNDHIQLGSLTVDTTTGEFLDSDRGLSTLELKFLKAVYQNPYNTEERIIGEICDPEDDSRIPDLNVLSYRVNKKLQSCSSHRIRKLRGGSFVIEG